MIWSEFLAQLEGTGEGMLSPSFVEQWSNEPWNPGNDDRGAAALLHTQIVSRIATQKLGYQDGTEQAALDSLFVLFQKTRDICDRFPEGRHFNALAWEVLNTHVRPFTARWHRESQRGALTALDSTDVFRAQLGKLQPILRSFDHLLLHIRDTAPPPARIIPPGHESEIEKEMRESVAWGISVQHGGLASETAAKINRSERDSILARRAHYEIPEGPNAVALALSGGGIRSATFALGVLVSLAERNILPQIDYLSTVSGGGYLGSFLSAFLESAPGKSVGLSSNELPFQRQDGEAEALRHIRHFCKYLITGSLWQRLKMMFAQLYGMAINGFSVVFVVILIVSIERWLRSISFTDYLSHKLTVFSVVMLAVGSLAALLTMRARSGWRRYADSFVAIPSVVLILLLCWLGLGNAHTWYHSMILHHVLWPSQTVVKWLTTLAAIPIVTSALTGFFGRLLKHAGTVLIVLSGIATPLFFFGLYFSLYEFAARPTMIFPYIGQVQMSYLLWAILIVGSLIFFFVLDINFTSPHRHYRDRLADAFLIQPRANPSQQEPFEQGVSIRLSELGQVRHKGPYHLINCALNVPGSKNISMQGRLTDFFVFSPAFSGSPLVGYYPTQSWEEVDPHLDLGTAMAVSGAAAAPQMGLGTKKTLSFWLALLNIRLGYWTRHPKKTKMLFRGSPGLSCLVKEMLGTMNEQGPWLNLTDGGHIENLGVYELLRRRCKYIIAIDGEEDQGMTFSALTTLQRLAAIDLGIRIDINLDDLRLNQRGLSRSHFRFCRIHYPIDGRGSEEQIGYLLYLKLSLTGNEGEFIRRFRTDDPVFPHDSTTNQFFSEAQFEAYRSLGEHIGDKLFLESIIGNCANSKSVEIDQWFLEMGKSLLDPLPPKTQ